MKLASQFYNWMSTTLKGRYFTGISALILFGGLLSILPLLIFVQEQREDDALMNLTEVLHMQNELIADWQDELTRDINYLSELPEASSDDKESFYEKLELLGNNRTLFYDLFYADETGSILYNTNDDAATRKISVYDTPYFQQGMEWHTYTTGIRLIGDEDMRSVIFSAPVTNGDGRFGGILAGIVLADSIRYVVSDFAYGETGVVYLVDKSGTVLSSSSNEFPSSMKETDIFQRALKREKQTDTYQSANGVESWGQYTWINQDEWVLISEVSSEEIAKPFHDTVLFMSIILLVIFILSYVFTKQLIKQMTRPIGALLEGTSIISKGNYQHRIQDHVFDRTAKEFKELFKAYNKMAQDLEHEQFLRLQAEEDMRRSHEQLRLLSLSDGLTGIGNRRFFDEELAVQLKKAAQANQPLSLILIDIDFFKKYNDQYGHDAGDLALKRVAGALDDIATSAGLSAARYGGEEMAVLVPSHYVADLHQLGKEIIQAVKALHIAHESSPTGWLSVSIGMASIQPTPSTPARLLIQEADKALYLSKQNGRDQATIFPGM